MSESKIEWTDRSDWNPVRGCTRVSPGCGGPGPHGGCYAEAMAARFSLPGMWGHGFAEMKDGKPRWTGKVELQEDRLTLPLNWRKSAKIFVSSTSDIFHESLPDEAIDKIFAVMALCPQHTFQVLTKRAERMRDYCTALTVGRLKKVIEDYGNSLGPDTEDFEFFGKIGWEPHLAPCKPDCAPPCAMVWRADGSHTIRAKDSDGAAKPSGECGGKIRWDGPIALPLPNVWLGVSCERQQEADERIPLLLATPAAIRFISAEPLLGPIRLHETLGDDWLASGKSGERKGLDWVIVGGESGPRARPFDVAWAELILNQCHSAGVPCFIKQLGSQPIYYGQPLPTKLKSTKGGDLIEWPADVRVREFPQVRA